MRLSLTTVMLPRWNLDEIFDNLAASGYQGVELRCRRNPEDPNVEPSFWGRHVCDISPENLIEEAPRIRAAANRTGLPVIALSPRMAPTDYDQIDKLFRGAVRINEEHPPMIRVDPPGFDRNRPYLPQFEAVKAQFATLIEKATPFRIKLLYEIHVGTLAVSCSRAYELLRGLDPAHIGAIYDIPNMTRVGIEDPLYAMQVLGPYLAHCHIGGSRPVVLSEEGPNQKWGWEMCDVRKAAVDIPEIIRCFKKQHYQGYLSLEEFGPGDDLAKIKDQGAYLRGLISSPT